MKTIRIAAGSGFWGDRLDAPVKQVRQSTNENSGIDYLVLDYLAELTLSIMAAQREKDPSLGYAKDFVDLMQELAPDLTKSNLRIIANAGGLNPSACALRVREALRAQGCKVPIAVVSGDDIKDKITSWLPSHNFNNLETGEALSTIISQLNTANAYLGCGPIVAALNQGARIVITGRVADAALALGPMVYQFAWKMDDWDKLALGTIAGHAIECGAQATGGNYGYDWQSIPRLSSVGFPIIEVSGENSAIITKHPGTGGRVDLPGIKEQLVYEIGDPRSYITPDVIADFTAIALEQVAEDKVRITQARGRAPTEFYKVSASYFAGYRSEGTMLYSWPDAYAKAQAAAGILRERFAALGLVFDDYKTEFIGASACHGSLAGDNFAQVPEILLRVAARSKDKSLLARFSREFAPLVLSGPPSATGYAVARAKPTAVYGYWPTLVPKSLIETKVEILE